jgi:DNA polymerase-1
MSHIYRAFFAVKGLTNRDGMPTNAVYGFTSMLKKLIREETPELLAVAFETIGPTVRHEQFEDYKATRPKMPDELSIQIPYIRRVCEAFQIPVIEFQKYEADDVIATLCRQGKEAGFEVVIVTIDKDLFQLVEEKVSILDTRSNTFFDVEKVEEKWGVKPSQILDLLSLIGDSSDNIPGAPGIGEKGAKDLISKFESLENLLANREEVSRKSYRNSLEENEGQILASRELIRIYDDLPLEVKLEDLKVEEPDTPQLRELFTQLGFTSFLSELAPKKPEAGLKTHRVESGESVKALSKKLKAGRIAAAIWTEGQGILTAPPFGLAVADGSGNVWYLPAETLKTHQAEIGSLLIENQWVFHDLKSVLLALQNGEYSQPSDCLDTMLISYLLEPNKSDYSLAQVGLEYLGYRVGETGEQQKLILDESPEQLCEKANAVYKLSKELMQKVIDNGLEKVLTDIELPLVEVLVDMESRGVRIDSGFLGGMSYEITRELKTLEEKVFELAGEEFNLNSPRQLSQVLFEKMQLPPVKKTGKAGHYSTGVEVLEELSEKYDIANYILEYRELAKLKSTYLDSLPKLVNPKTGRIHTSYNQMVASTGRLSSSNPNLQNIPIRTAQGKKVRKAFIPKEGFEIVAADYSQIELRVMAHLSGDPVLTDAFNQGEDIHTRTAMEVFGTESGLAAQEMRRRAKVINFGIMYGLSPFGLAKSLKISHAEARQFISDYFANYQGVKNWIDKTLEEVEATGYVKTLFGRIRQIPEMKSKNRNLREFGKRTAVNAPIQGTAADLIKMAMIAIYRRLIKEELESRLILQVHDELVLEVKPDESEVIRTILKEEMEGVAELSVPLTIEIASGPSWFDAK